MFALGGIAVGHSAFPVAWNPGNATNATNPVNLTNDQTSDHAALASVSQATEQLTSDQQPRGTPSAIAADQQAVKIAQEDASKAAEKLKSDQAQTAGLDVLA